MMTNETYNKLQILCTVLKNRFSELRFVTKGIYKVYNSETIFFDKTTIQVLEKFEDLNLRKLYRDEILKNLTNQNEWLTSSLFKKEAGEFYISHDLEIVIYYFLVNTFSRTIQHFLDFLDIEQSNFNSFMLWDESKTKITIKRGVQETLFNKLKELDNTKYIWHLLSKVSNGIIYATNEFDFVIETERISKLLLTSQEYNFELLNEKFPS